MIVHVPSSNVRIEPLTSPHQVREAFAVFGRAMIGLDFGDLDAATITEDGRYFGAFDGERIVGGADSYATSLTVPGGARLPHAAVTHIGVLPTHRRRGVLTALIARQLTEAAARGEAVATLRASEAVIYGRYGYGIASHSRSARIDRIRTGLRQLPDDPGAVRIADDVDVSSLAAIHERITTPGATTRSASWWVNAERRAHAEPLRYVIVHSTDGVDDGYAVYRPLDSATWWTSRNRTIQVTDFVALNSAAHRALWAHLFSLDLVDTITVASLSVDDPLPLLVTDQRSVQLGEVHDEIWLRLIDVEAALAARSYGQGRPVTIAVRDRRLPSNEGRYRITADGAERSSTAADVTVDVADLASVYLGGTRWRQLAAAGRLHEGSAHPGPDVIAALDLLFATDHAPFSGTMF
ncbi:GNAT family N-acetyltransferase [Gordonia sp. MMO-8]|uniref:GNAT family N-acetyltransferase n=1 Tax=Gordonia sp. MMO-8 TaxID=3127886 RepID=UPI003FA5D5DE